MESGRSVGHLDELLVVADPIALAREAAKRVVAIAEEAVARCGRFTVALAGGSTPKRLYALLAAEPYRTRLPWQKAHIFWGDERAVPPEHPNSNFGMARATLLSRVPIPSDQIHRMQAERPDLDAAARDYETEIARTFTAQPSGELHPASRCHSYSSATASSSALVASMRVATTWRAASMPAEMPDEVTIE